MLFHARGVEVVRGAAQRHNQRVIRQLALRYQQLALLITQFCQGNGFAFAVDIHHRTQLELETVVARMCQIAQRVNALIQRTGSHFVQERFPQVAVVTIDECYFGLFTATKLLS